MADTSSVPRSFCVLTEPVVYLLLFLVLFSPALKAQTTASWNDGTGHWSTAKDWTPNGAPNNGGGTFYNVVINGTGSDTVTFDSSGTVINSLSLGSGETLKDNGHSPSLTIGDPAFPAAGTLTNAGTINWRNGSTLILDITAGDGSITNSGVINLRNSTLKINDSGNGNTAVLSGGGTVNLARGLITGAFGDETLTNNDNTIQGSGTIRNLTLVNNGTINANAVQPLTITPNSGGFTNNGTVNVTGLGGLVINAGPTPAMNTGTMDVNNSSLTVRGGFAESLVGFFPGPTLTLQNGSVGTITGAVTGFGTLNVDASSLKVLGNFNNPCCSSVLADVSLSLSRGSSAFVAGNFSIASGSLTVDDSALTIQGSYFGTLGNPASIQNGGTLAVHGDFEVGQQGILGVAGGSSVTVSGSMDNFISLVTVDRSTLTVQGDYSAEDSAWTTLGNGSTLTVKGTFTNGFPGELDGGMQNFCPGGVSCLGLGPGSVASFHAVQNNSFVGVDAGSLFTVGSGGFANNSGASLKLGGLLNSVGGFTNSGGTVVTDPGSALIASTYSQNGGLTDVSGNLVAKSYQQSAGSTVIETGGIVSANTFNASGGTVTVNGILDPTAVEIGSRGTLQGSGIVNGNVFNRGSIIAGAFGSPLTFNINGNYTQNATGIFTELIGSKGNGLLNISGAAALAPGASLNVQLVGGFDPKNGTTFTIMDYGSEKGSFTMSDPYFDNGKQQWVVSSYAGGGGHDVLLTAEASNVVTPEPSTMLLVGTVLLGMGGYAKKRRASSAAR
jgi:hypothetical protein